MWYELRSRIKVLTYFSAAILFAYVAYLAGSPRIEIAGGPVAQLVEQRTFNPQVVGSIPTRPTITFAPATTTPMATTTTTVASATTTTTTTTVPTKSAYTVEDTAEARPIPFLIDNQYGFYEKGSHIVELQRLLGLRFVDGIYGPDTRKAHMEWFGSPQVAQRHFFDRGTWYIETVDPEMEWQHNWADWDEPPSLQQLVDIYFLPEDRPWALRVAFCESSAKPTDTYSNAVSHALAVGWFQHLSRFWLQRSELAGWPGYDIFDTEPNVAVAAWLFYSSGGHHWNPSKPCWGGTSND
jgi:hypothetical protein